MGIASMLTYQQSVTTRASQATTLNMENKPGGGTWAASRRHAAERFSGFSARAYSSNLQMKRGSNEVCKHHRYLWYRSSEMRCWFECELSLVL